MAFEVEEVLMAPGNWSVDLDNTPVIYNQLAREDGTARDLHALVWDTWASPEVLAYPPLVLRRVNPGSEVLTIGGLGVHWHLGMGDTGPRVTYAEYISGANMLSNASFERGGLYWRRVAEDSRWVLNDWAFNAGGLDIDDVLEFDRPFPTIPGHSYRLVAMTVTGSGMLRARITFTGRFNPPNILGDPSFTEDGWSLTPGIVTVTPENGLTIGPIPKPQLIENNEFSDATGWTLGPNFFIAGGGLVANPIPQPQYIEDPPFETGTGWTPQTSPAPMSPDIVIAHNPAQAKSGSWVLQVGPVTQHQLLTNADFGMPWTSPGRPPFWFPSSTGRPEPDLTIWEPWPGDGVNGSDAVKTTGYATAGRSGPETIKYLRADASDGGGVEAYDVKPGETYRAESYFAGAPGTEGQALLTLHMPHPTVPNHEIWAHSYPELKAPPNDAWQWKIAAIDSFTIPANRFKLNVLIEIRNQGLGHWKVDHCTITRIRGNRAQANSDTNYPVVAHTSYELAVLVRSGGAMQVGSVRVGVILTGPDVEPEIVDVDKGSTDFEWSMVRVPVRPSAGYTTATPFVAALDIIGDPVWVDNMTFTKVEGNTDIATYEPKPIVADQRYLLGAEVTCTGATRGTITVGVTLTGDGVAPTDVEVTMGVTPDMATKALPPTEVRAAPGYTHATLFVRSTDVEGGQFLIDRPTLTKMDNNTVKSTGQVVTVTPERTYRWTEDVVSGAALQRGTVHLSVTCKRAGFDDIVFDSAPAAATDGTRHQLVFEVTPPSGYDEIIPDVVGTDIEGDNWYVANGQMRDVDTGTVVFDAVSAVDPAAASPFVNATAPEGAESVRAAVVVMAGTSGWSMAGVSLARTGVPIATGASVLADILTHPDTGDPLSILPGTIDAPDPIPYDWIARNMHRFAQLNHLCTVVAAPPLEYKINAALPPTMDASPFPFVDHAPGGPSPVVYRPQDIDVQTLPRVETNTEGRATEIELIGAELESLSGQKYFVTATAQVPGSTERDLGNRPIRRTKQVQISTVDHDGYAIARAEELARLEAEPPLSVTATLNELDDDTATELGEDPRPPVGVGDYVYPWKPEAGLKGGPEYATTIKGETVFPRRMRVLSRHREHVSVGSAGSRYRIEMLRPDGTTFPLVGVRPSPEDVTTLTLGDRFLPWEADPQGTAESEQWFADRARAPR